MSPRSSNVLGHFELERMMVLKKPFVKNKCDVAWSELIALENSPILQIYNESLIIDCQNLG